MTRLRRKIVPVLFVCFLITACTDADLTTVAKALTDTAQGVSVFQTTVIQANTQGLLTEAVTRKCLEAAIQVNTAGKQAVSVTRGINALGVRDRTSLLGILRPVIASLGSVQFEISAGIHDVKTQQAIQAGLLAIQTSLNIAEVALASKGQ